MRQSPALGQAMRYEWFEVYIDPLSEPPYLLILGQLKGSGALEIFDPISKEVAYSPASVEDAALWLTDEEYNRVEGRETALDAL